MNSQLLKVNKRKKSNTICDNLCDVVDLSSKKKTKMEATNLKIPVYHVLEQACTTSHMDTESEKKESNTNDMYSVVDLKKIK